MVRGLLLMGMALASGTMAAENPLAAHRWKARVVVMSAPGPDDPHLLRQRALLAAVTSERLRPPMQNGDGKPTPP